MNAQGHKRRRTELKRKSRGNVRMTKKKYSERQKAFREETQ